MKIRSTWNPDGEEMGFGFIAGERNNLLYVATANHLVRSAAPDGPNRKIQVKFFAEQGRWYDAELLDTALGDKDLAVVRCAKPFGLAWEKNSLARDTGELAGREVWFIGRTDTEDSWYIPSRPGSINRGPTTDSRLIVDIANVRVGTSGAPLITASGVIGMIITDTGSALATALHIDTIKQAFDQWQYPWGLQAGTVREDPISGSWSFYIDASTTPVSTLTLKLQGTKVSGQMKDNDSENPANPIVDGSWVEGRLRLKFVDDDIIILLDGSFRGEELIGSIDVSVKPDSDTRFLTRPPTAFVARKITK